MNTLYPIFLKAEHLHLLIVGGGNVALEKLTFLLKSSPHAQVTVVAKEIREEIKDLAQRHPVQLITAAYAPQYLEGAHFVIATTDDLAVNRQVREDCRSRHKLVNVADTPDQCDFYLGGIVTKGDLKIAISTNGKSPTLAKRLRELFEAVFPDNTQELLDNMQHYRRTLKGTFDEKVAVMNELTKDLLGGTR